MGTTVLSLRIDEELLERLRRHAARRGMSVQDYVVGTLIRDDFDARFSAAVEETERFYGTSPEPLPAEDPGRGTAAGQPGTVPQVSPSAGIR
ncbi:ribbon-helix-helix protein, CopG family [Streptomyces sp. NPDC058001]|uniref:ribbon-helix-helix protein, CopG family n=1 Tax=Streptomyces sp. NPDC058001 TaxID=3346300 RepID=UPI0036E56A40